MSRVPQKNIDAVVNALEEFHNRMVETQQFNLQEFFNFMEPKFTEAGYRDTTPPRCRSNVLIIHDTAAGDLITQSGAIREIRRLYPDAHITFVVAPGGFQLAECCPHVDEIILNSQRHPRHSFVESYEWNIGIARQLLQRRFDVCYAFIHHPATPSLMYMSGAKTRITHFFKDNKEAWNEVSDVPLTYSINLATNLYPMFTYGDHIVDCCFSLLDHTLHAPVKNRSIEAWYTPFDVTVAESVLRGATSPIYALCMGGSGYPKHYPPEKYARLLEIILRKEPTATFVILGGGDFDLQSAEIIKNTVPEIYEKHVIDLTDKVSYRQSAAILSLCDMYIGNDTGTMHSAAAVKCPVLTIHCFPADLPSERTAVPKLWRPYGVPNVIIQPAHALSGCDVNEPYTPYGCRGPGMHCIAQVTPETVYKGFKLLKKRIAEKNIGTLYIS